MSSPASIVLKREAILDQLGYLLDELEAQRPWLMKIPAFQVEGKPLDSVPSLLDLYREMARKEWVEHVTTLTGMGESLSESASLSEVVDSIQSGRESVLRHLEHIPAEKWDLVSELPAGSLTGYAFQITQSDATFLRAIAERLHESLITFAG